MDGFQVILQQYCSYCPDFESKVEKVDCTLLGDTSSKTMNNIRCCHEGRCSNIAENIKACEVCPDKTLTEMK